MFWLFRASNIDWGRSAYRNHIYFFDTILHWFWTSFFSESHYYGVINLKKNSDAPGPLRDLVKSLQGLFGFSHLRLLHRICKTRHFKISKKYRFLIKKSTYLPKTWVLHEKLKLLKNIKPIKKLTCTDLYMYIYRPMPEIYMILI